MDHLTAIRVFQRIAETRSFTKAAAHLDMPRSSVSKALLELEQHLGAKLVQRTTRSVSLTLEGAEYYRRISQIVARLDETEASLRGMGAASRGRLRIDLHSSLAQFVLIPVLDEFRALYPHIQLALGVSDRPVNLVEEGVDCVIRAGKLADSSLIARTLYKDRLITCASPGYLDTHGVPASPEDLKRHVVVGYFGATNGEAWPLQFRSRAGHTQTAAFNLAANDSASQVAMILNGLGIGQTHASVVDRFLQSGALVPVLEAYTDLRIPVSVIYPSNRQLNARVRVFIDWIVQRLSRPTDVG